MARRRKAREAAARTDAAAATPERAAVAPHAHLPPPLPRGLLALPDGLVACWFAWLAFASATGRIEWPALAIDAPLLPGVPSVAASTLVLLEGLFLFPQLTLIDVASRLKKRPPWWSIPLLLLGLLALAPGGAAALSVLYQGSNWLLLPGLWALGQRAWLFWRLPVAGPLERMRARALAAGRLNAALACGLPPLAWIMFRSVTSDYGVSVSDYYFLVCPLIALWFALSAFDLWRVHGPRFAQRPSVLGGYDALGVKDHSLPL